MVQMGSDEEAAAEGRVAVDRRRKATQRRQAAKL
jgi:hypothetical protein